MSPLNQSLLSDNPGIHPPVSSGLGANEHTLACLVPQALVPAEVGFHAGGLSDPKDTSLLLSDRIQSP